MDIIDFGRSFVTFTNPVNNARLQIESQLELTDEATGESEVYLLFASCKSEDTYAADALFRVPNYDFSGIFDVSKTDFSIFRVFSTCRDYLETGAALERFDDLTIHLAPADATLLEDNDAIIAATLRHAPLVSRTELWRHERRVRAVVDCPIKTMNVNPSTHMYQVDTGPMLYPDFASAAERRIEWLLPAFVAYNRADRAEFVMQAPTPVPEGGEELLKVMHYSRIETHDARNSIFAL